MALAPSAAAGLQQHQVVEEVAGIVVVLVSVQSLQLQVLVVVQQGLRMGASLAVCSRCGQLAAKRKLRWPWRGLLQVRGTILCTRQLSAQRC